MSQPIYKPVRDGGHRHKDVVIAVDKNTLGLAKVAPTLKMTIHELPDNWRLCEAVEVDMPRADWSQAPEWAMWWTINGRGDTWWFDKEPKIDGVYWCRWDKNHHRDMYGPAINIPLGIDWRLLKERRPQEV